MGRDVFFNTPQAAFLLFILLPILIGYLLLIRYRKRRQDAYAAQETIARLLTPRSRLMTFSKIGGWLIIWSLVCLALMEPFGNIRYPSLPGQASGSAKGIPHFAPHEIIFLTDTSASMGVPDGTDGNTRLEEAKLIMEDIMRQLNGQMVSLYAFTSELSAVVPSTLDYLFVRLSINDLHLDEGAIGGDTFWKHIIFSTTRCFPRTFFKNNFHHHVDGWWR